MLSLATATKPTPLLPPRQAADRGPATVSGQTTTYPCLRKVACLLVLALVCIHFLCPYRLWRPRFAMAHSLYCAVVILTRPTLGNPFHLPRHRLLCNRVPGTGLFSGGDGEQSFSPS